MKYYAKQSSNKYFLQLLGVKPKNYLFKKKNPKKTENWIDNSLVNLFKNTRLLF